MFVQLSSVTPVVKLSLYIASEYGMRQIENSTLSWSLVEGLAVILDLEQPLLELHFSELSDRFFELSGAAMSIGVPYRMMLN
jgi:hypothetical protein